MPFNDFLVEVSEVIRGQIGAETLVVTFPGGLEEGTLFTVEGLESLPVGEPLMFFLSADGTGKYYAMAGGLAVALLAESGEFVLPGEALGGDPLNFAPHEVVDSQSDSLKLTLIGPPAIRLNGVPQSGNFQITTEDDGTASITGTALIDGSAVELLLTVEDRAAAGSVFVDGQEYLLADGRVAKAGPGTIKLTGSARQGSSNRVQILELTLN